MARDPALTSKIMAAIKSKNTSPELKLRRALWSRGLRFRVTARDLPGQPDLVFSRVKMAVFCDGDYWHGHNWALRGFKSLEEELLTYKPYWRAKILGNVRRDEIANLKLRELGWTVLRFWASLIDADVGRCVDQVESEYRRLLALIE
ncbi:MAG: very short patch repair endonuclease [Deltaproteobacteria bacterium]|jgi:DNA mismatch endonuclease (patch repair protein)|nr:very short patch repair endonuclease [Deltaproteobacteria bacterium]